MGKYFKLMKKYGHFFAVLEKTAKGGDKGDVCFVGWDTEYVESEKGRRNKILSYAVTVFSRRGCAEKVYLTVNGKRLSSKQIVLMALREVYQGQLPAGKIQVFFVAHFSAAEVAALADRDQIRLSLRDVRKSAITKRMLRIKTGSTQIFMHLSDTRLISPADAQSLENLGLLSGESDSEKIILADKYKSRMDLLLREDPELFMSYAIRDAWVTLEAFLLLQDNLNRLAFGEFRRIFKTLGSASVAGFIERNPEAKSYLKSLRHNAFRNALNKMRQCFHGGLCINYFVGETREHPPTRHHIIVDLDISSAYPVFMYSVGMIDTLAAPLVIPARYEISVTVVEELMRGGLDKDTLATLKRTLDESPALFVANVHRLVKSRKLVARVLAATAVIDNSLLEKWVAATRVKKDAFGVSPDSYVILGCAYVRFEFPKSVMNPSLAISHSRYGLQYVRTGETLATSVEIITAIEAGAKVDALYSVEFPLKRGDDGEPEFLLRGHLSQLVTERRGHPKGTLMNLLYKEAINSFYGKLAQGINRRKVKEISTSESKELGPSPITEPMTASMTTGISRAALSALTLSVERFNEGRPEDKKIYVISGTTDGVLLALPAPPGTSVNEFYLEKNGKSVFAEPPLLTVLARFGCEGLLKEMERFSILRQVAYSSRSLVGTDHFLEVKHVADHVVGIKSRGQIGYLNDGRVSILAKCGHRPPRPHGGGKEEVKIAEGQWLHNQFKESRKENAVVTTYTTQTLPSLAKILDPGGPDDMVMVTSTKRINVDYDYKRKLLRDEDNKVSPVTVPHDTFGQMIRYRRVMERLRKRGECATPVRVDHELAYQGRSTRLVHGDAGAIVRGVLRWAMQEHSGVLKDGSYAEIAQKLTAVWRARRHPSGLQKRAWTRDDVKNATRGKFEPGVVLATRANVQLVDELCLGLGLESDKVRLAFFSHNALDEVLDRVVEAVVLAVLHAPKMGLEPFVGLHREGLLPDRRELADILFPRVTDLAVMAHARGAFIPGKLSEQDQGSVARIFCWFGIPKELARAAAKVIAPTTFRGAETAATYNDRLLDEFVMAVLDQSVVAPAPVPGAEVLLTKLRVFGLTVNRFKRLRSSRLNPHAFANTPRNRQQVKDMAQAIGLPAAPLLAVLLGRRS